MPQNYDNLEDQIGAMGGDTPAEGTKLGKLQHKAAYGQKEDLNNSEEESFKKFLSNEKRAVEKKKIIDAAPVAQGWIPINREEMGIRSLFYPSDWEFMIRPATVQAIKNWTAIDEERPDVVIKVFNEILKTCVKIDTHSAHGAGWAQINHWDRFWFVLKIREYTFVRGESKVEFTDQCSCCGEDMTYTLNSKNIHYEFPDDELVEKYWNGSEWHIDPKEYDVDHDEIVLYTPKLGKEEAIFEWARSKAQQKQKIDEVFIKFLFWMLNKPSSDPAMLDHQIKQIYNEYKSWDIEMFEFMDDVINNLTINPKETLKCTCPSCGQEATSNVQFPDGIKVLFTVKTKAKKFGSR